MIDNWLDDTGRQVVKRISPIAWIEGKNHYRLIFSRTQRTQQWLAHDAWRDDCFLLDTVVLALLRDHAMEWLAEHKVAIFADTQDGRLRWYAVRMGKNGVRYTLMADGKWLNTSTAYIDLGPLFCADYDAALIAAVLATEGAE